mgnify:CR=1 FL=1
MGVKVVISGVLPCFTGIQEIVEVQGNTVGQCLDDLVERFPGAKKRMFEKDGKLRVLIFINQEGVYIKELSTPVKDGDELHIAPIIAGG